MRNTRDEYWDDNDGAGRIRKGQEYLLREIDGLHHLGAEHGLLAVHELLEKVDGDIVVWRQVDADVGGEEVVHLALAAVLGRELLGRDLRLLRLKDAAQLHWRISAVHLLQFLYKL